MEARRLWAPAGGRTQHVALFFPSSAATSLWKSSRGIVTAVQGHGPPKVRVWAPWGSFIETPLPVVFAPEHKEVTQGEEEHNGQR